MPCSVTIQDVRGVIPSGQTEITILRVAGDAPGCNEVTITSNSLGVSATAQVINNQFVADLPITVNPKPVCGASIDLHVECDDPPDVCFPVTIPLRCCEIDILWVQGLTPGHVLNPTAIQVAGHAFGCPHPPRANATVTVTVTTSTGAVIGTASTSVDDNSGSFSATVPIGAATPVVCGETVTVVASCASGMTCQHTETFTLNCADCYRVVAVPNLSAPCVGPVGSQYKKIALDFQIGLPTGVTSRDFYWDYGGGIQSSPFTATVSATNPIFRDRDIQDLPAGHYTACLRFVRNKPENCVEYCIHFDVVCGGGGSCPVVHPTPVIDPTCANGKHRVTLAVDVNVPAGQTLVANWDYDGAGTLGPPIVVSAPAAGPAAVTTVSQDHNYLPGTYTATLHTTLPTNCPDQTVTFTVPACPTDPCALEITAIDVIVGNCDPATGKREVTATATVSGANSTDQYQWQWQAMVPSTTSLPAPQGLTQTHWYDAPGPVSNVTRETITLTAFRDLNCHHSLSVPVDIPGCGTACPQIDNLQLDAAAAPCTPDGSHRTVSLNASITGSGVNEYVWTFGDGATQTIPGNAGPATTHDFAAPGTYTVDLEIKGPGNCDTHLSQQVMVPVCCPTITGIGVAQSPCQTGTPTVPVQLTAQGTGAASSFAWDFGDGTPAVSTTTTQAPLHNYAIVNNAPTQYTATVTANEPGCPPARFTLTFTVNPCNETPPPSKTSIDLCTGLLWTAIIISIIGAIAVLVGCVLMQIPYTALAGEIVSWIGLGLITLAAVLFLLWWIFCRFITPCDVILTFIHLLLVLIPVFALISIIVGLLGSFNPLCWVKAVATFAYWGTVLGMLYWLANNRHCITENPSGGSASSSSSPLTNDGPARLEPPPSAVRERPHATPQAQPRGADRPQALAAVAVSGPPEMPVKERTQAAGLGDVVKSVTSAIGIHPCAGCHKRAEALNRAFPFGGVKTPPADGRT